MNNLFEAQNVVNSILLGEIKQPIQELFPLYPEYPPEWIIYAFLRWCHPLGALAWKPGHEKALQKDESWISWLSTDCLQFLLQDDEEFKDFLSKELVNFLAITETLGAIS